MSDGKKRLSTIPASPAVKTEPRDDNKENALDAVREASTKSARPTLGGRQSTRSVALAQRIREFEIVNQMLQVAMAQEGDGEDQEQVQSEAAITIAKLKADLSQTVDQEAVEAQVEDVEIPEPSAGIKEKSAERELFTSRNDEIISLKEQLAESQEIVNTLTADLEQLTDKVAAFSKSAEEESQKVQQATEEIRSKHIEKVESLISSHKQEMQMLRAETEDEIEEKKSSHATEAAALRAELVEAKASLARFAQSADENESLKSAHAKELEALQEQMKDAESSVATHELNLSKLRAELDETRTSLSAQQERSALDVKQEDHEAAIREIEEAKRKQIDNIKQSHMADMSDLQSKLDQATQASTDTATQQKIEISRLGEVIERLQNEIQARDEANMEETETRISAIKNEHDKAMSAAVDAAKSSSSGEVETLRKTLTAEFQTIIDDLQNELANAHEQASKSLQDAKAASEEQIHVLETKVRSLSGEMEGYKMQSQTFKQILSSSEKETQEKDEEHAEAISKLQDDVATSVKRATEQQMKVMDMSMRLDQEVAKRDALEKTHAKAIEDLEAEHEAMKTHRDEASGGEIKDLKEQHGAIVKNYRSQEESLTRQVNELQLKHDNVHEQLTAQEETHNQTLKDLQSKHDETFKEMQDNAAIRQQELESLKTEYANADDSSKKLAVSHKRELEALQAKYDQAVKELDDRLNEHIAQLALLTTQNAAHSEAMKALETSHAEQVKALKAQHAEGISDIKSSADEKDVELAEINAKCAELEQKLEMSGRRDAEFENLTIQNTNMATELKSLEAAHSAYLEELRKGYMEEIKVAENAAKVHESELQRLKKQETESNDAVESSKDAHAKEINALKSQHADQLTKLQSASKDQAAELDKLKMQHGLATEEVKANEAAHSREIEELQAKHSATLEAVADAQIAEIERVKKEHSEALQNSTTSEKVAEDSRADSIKSAELLKEMQIKIASLEAELALSSTTDTPSSKSPKKKESKKSVNGNGSPGLVHSKWAQAEPTTPLKQEYGTMRGGSGDDETSPAGATDISSMAPTPASASRKDNIEGQLAGMQEQLKHLDEIDAEMLEQHERMARTLSRVDDTTVVTSEEN